MNSQQLLSQPNALHFELPDRPPTEQELIRLAWLDLFGHLKDICDTLNAGGGLDWFYLPAGAKLLYERPSPAEHKIVYRGEDWEYRLQFNIDFDLRYVRVRCEPYPFFYQRMISVHDEQAFLFKREYGPPYPEETMEAAAKGWMYELVLVDDGMDNTPLEAI
jgi:hypothetical protein